MSEIIFLIITIISMITIPLAYNYLDKKGLYIMLIIMTIVSYLLSFKVLNIWGLSVNANVITTISILEIVYLLIEKETKKNHYNYLFLTIFCLIATAFAILTTSSYIPSINDTLSTNMKGLFIDNYQILIIFPLLLIITEIVSHPIYLTLNQIYQNKIISINLIYMVLGLLNSLIFSFIAYASDPSFLSKLNIALATYFIGLIISILYTPIFNYLTSKKKVRLWILSI